MSKPILTLSDDIVRLAGLASAVLGPYPTPMEALDENIVALALRRHCIGPLVHEAVLSGKCHAEPDLCALLEKRYRTNIFQQAVETLTLQLISPLFEKAGITWTTLKGVEQARQLYPTPAFRESIDIDILVKPRDFDRAIGILESAKYTAVNPRLPSSSVFARIVCAPFRDISLTSSIKQLKHIELHRRLFHAAGMRANSLSLLPDRPPTADVIPAPALNADLGFYLIAHGAMSCWVRLKWLVDLVPLFAQLSDNDKSQIVAKAAKMRTQSSMAASLLLLKALFPFVALGPLETWVEERQANRDVQRRLALYIWALNRREIGVKPPIYNQTRPLRAAWLFFEAPSSRVNLLVHGLTSAALRRIIRAISRMPHL